MSCTSVRRMRRSVCSCGRALAAKGQLSEALGLIDGSRSPDDDEIITTWNDLMYQIVEKLDEMVSPDTCLQPSAVSALAGRPPLGRERSGEIRWNGVDPAIREDL